MVNKRTKYPVIEKFRQLSLQTRTLDYLSSLGNELKNYHYNDLMKLNSIETIRNLSEENQLLIIKSIIENRRRINISNKKALMDILLRQNSGIPAELWAELVLQKVSDLDQMYNHTKQAMKGINKKDKNKLVSALKLHSIKNLEAIIYIRESISKLNT